MASCTSVRTMNSKLSIQNMPRIALAVFAVVLLWRFGIMGAVFAMPAVMAAGVFFEELWSRRLEK